MDSSTLIPVHVLTGFLGSGKTTLLNQALQAGFGAETAVIVNEFGDVGLDQLFVQTRSQETIVLKSGCVCCTIRTDLVSTLLQLVAVRGAGQPFRRILIETSGISDPVPILQTLRSDFNLVTRFKAGSVVCTAGAADGTPWEERAEGLAQITAADAIVITKRDLVDDETALAVQAAIVALNPLAEILPADGAQVVGWLERAEARGDDAQRALRLLRLPLRPGHVPMAFAARSFAPRRPRRGRNSRSGSPVLCSSTATGFCGPKVCSSIANVRSGSACMACGVFFIRRFT